MKENINILKKEFDRIKNLGWIKSERKGTSGIGYTFEKLLGKEEDNFYLPDFQGIEIKTKRHFSKGYLTLFNLTPDGEYLFPIEYIRNKYGYKDKEIPSQKVFQYTVSNENKSTFMNKIFRLKINYNNNKIVLEIINLIDYSKDTSISWSFEEISQRIYNKISYLALVKADIETKNEVEYIKYYDIEIYKLKDLKTFLSLIEDGTIRITFKIGIFHSGTRIGQVHDHGTGFDIHKNDIKKLYDQII